MHKDNGLLDGVTGTGREINRRTIAKGVAWTVPVVIVATAAPAAAASGGLSFTAQRVTGNIVVTVLNNNGVNTTVALVSVTPGTGWTMPPSQNIPKNKSKDFTLVDRSPGATVLTISYTADGVGRSTSVAVA
jgi:hypothetical protein